MFHYLYFNLKQELSICLTALDIERLIDERCQEISCRLAPRTQLNEFLRPMLTCRVATVTSRKSVETSVTLIIHVAVIVRFRRRR